MNMIRKSFGTILILGSLAGCAGDAEPPTQPSPGQSPAVRPATGGPAGKMGDGAPSGKMIGAPPITTPAPADGKKTDEAPKVEGPNKTETSKPASKLSDEELAAVKELPAAEQAAALAQGVCPVSTHNLGSMGKPLKVTAEGRTFYICCDSCEEKVKTEGKAVVAKLDKMKAAK